MEDQKITIKEFKMWLEGVIEMQDDGWTPDPKQWTKILEKIHNINEESGTSKANRGAAREESYYQYHAPIVHSPLMDPSIQIDDSVPQQPIYAGPSRLSHAAPARPVGHNVFGNNMYPAQTPNIDTASESYTPPFV
jgi:hypothetical protein